MDKGEQLLDADSITSTDVSNFNAALETHYSCATYADVCAKIKEHELLHTVHYVVVYTRSMEKNFEDVMKKNHKIFFETKDSPYTGVLFLISSCSVLDCQHGADKGCTAKAQYRNRKNSEAGTDHSCLKKRIVLEDSKKFDCPAAISIKEIVEFPEFKIEKDSAWLRSEASKKLRKALAAQNDIVMCRKYILILPDISIHRNHPVGNEAGLSQPLSKSIINEIAELVRKGVNSVPDMRRHLDAFVQMKFVSNNILKTNKRFYPRDETIANDMEKARKNFQRSLIDQECLLGKIDEWKVYFPEACIYFRPKVEKSDNSYPALKNSLLFVYQDVWQKRLLLRYGNELTFLDATYRTTRYALPLFFLVVKKNVDYQVVAIFVCENETTEAITEALTCIKKWNPLFQPKCFLTDYCNEEINSLESVFPECCVIICDFHREQAWERWLSKIANGCCLEKDEIKLKLRQIAHAKTKEACQAAVQKLEESTEYKNNPKLIEYLKNTWLCILKRWVLAYRRDRLLINVNTNNGTERQNQTFKYSFLEKRKSSSLTSMLSICIEEFLPHKYDNYADENRRAHTSYRKYNANIPAYLINPPPPLVKHCMRMIDICQSVGLVGISSVTAGLYNVASFQSNNRDIYQCYFGDAEQLPYCSCPAWFESAYPCKHFFAIFIKENLSWSSFGSSYRNSPYFILDPLLDEYHSSTLAPCLDLLYSNNNLLENNHVNSAKSFCVGSSQNEYDQTKAMSFVDNTNSLGYNNLNSQALSIQHTPAACRELLNEIIKMTHLGSSQTATNNLFEGLCKLKNSFEETLLREKGILLHQECKPDIWSKPLINSPKLCQLPVRRKRKMAKRVGIKYDIAKKASNINLVVKVKDEVSFSEVVTNHVIDESCEMFTVPNSTIECEKEKSGDCQNLFESTEVSDDVQLQSAVQRIQFLKSSLIRNSEQNDIANGQMLDDNVIHLCQQMMSIGLKINEGLQDPIKGKVLSFNVHSSTPFVQFLHDGNLHWVCVSTYGCAPGEIFLFDSLFNGTISFDTKQQICSILHCEQKYLVIKVLPIQQQTNSVDCGLYAIAWARQILETKGMPSTALMFDQNQMRSHLLNCMLNNRLDVFPSTVKLAFKKCSAKTFRVRLHCSCRMLWNHKDEEIFNRQMAQCYTCAEWFHRECERIPQSAYEIEEELWNCHKCNSKLGF